MPSSDHSLEFSLIEEAEIRLSHQIDLGGKFGYSDIIRISLCIDSPSPTEFIKFWSSKDYVLLKEDLDLPTLVQDNDVRIYSILQKDFTLSSDKRENESQLIARAKMADSVLVKVSQYGALTYHPVTYTSAKAAIVDNGREEFSVAFNSLFKGKVIFQREIDERHATSTIRLFDEWLKGTKIYREEDIRVRKILVANWVSKPRQTKPAPVKAAAPSKPKEPWAYTLYALVAMAVGGLVVGYANMTELISWFDEVQSSNFIQFGFASLIAYVGLRYFRYEDNFTTYGFLIVILGLYLHFTETSVPYLSEYVWFENIQLFYMGLLLFIIGFLPGLVVIAFLPLQITIGYSLYTQYQAQVFGKQEYMALLIFFVTLIIQFVMYKKWKKKKPEKHSTKF